MEPVKANQSALTMVRVRRMPDILQKSDHLQMSRNTEMKIVDENNMNSPTADRLASVDVTDARSDSFESLVGKPRRNTKKIDLEMFAKSREASEQKASAML